MPEKNQKQNEYALLNFKHDSDETLRFQPVIFYEMHEDYSYENGTTLEEMLRVCFERLTDLDGRFPCVENKTALAGIQSARDALEARTQDRIKRGVEGTHQV